MNKCKLFNLFFRNFNTLTNKSRDVVFLLSYIYNVCVSKCSTVKHCSFHMLASDLKHCLIKIFTFISIRF